MVVPLMAGYHNENGRWRNSDLCFSITPIQWDDDYDSLRQQNLAKQ
ncbi:hypothetical protein [Xenorhabdus ehlersii]|nr:hypothetical protein [Xenorhabdus ehlersii]